MYEKYDSDSENGNGNENENENKNKPLVPKNKENDPAPEENGGIIQGNLNILILNGSGSFYANNYVNKILCNGCNGTAIERKFDEKKCFDEQIIQGGCANVTLLRCDNVTVKKNSSNFKDFCSCEAKKYDLIVVLGLSESSEKNVLDFVANKIKNGDDNNLIFYGNNFLSNGKNLNWFKYHLDYEFSCQELLEKIASFDKESKKFAGWEGKDKDKDKDKDNLDQYEQYKIDGLKGTAGEIAPKNNINKNNNHKNDFNPKAFSGASKIFKDHYGKILAGFGLFEEIFLGGIRKNLPKIFKSKETKKNKENKEHKAVEENKSANSDVEKERTL